LAIGGGTALAQDRDDRPEGMPADATGGTLKREVPASNLPGHGARHGGGGGNLIDHGGWVLPASNTYVIWWGDPSAFPADAQTGIDALLSGLSGTSFLGIADQYMRGAGISTAFHPDLTDTSTPPSRSPSVSTIVNEACKVISATASRQTQLPFTSSLLPTSQATLTSALGTHLGCATA
jgi:hypothetical protein